jgi:hypothetical protein
VSPWSNTSTRLWPGDFTRDRPKPVVVAHPIKLLAGPCHLAKFLLVWWRMISQWERAMWARLIAAAAAICLGALSGLSPISACEYRTIATSAVPPSAETIVSSLSGPHGGVAGLARLGLLTTAAVGALAIGLYRRRINPSASHV